MVGRRVVRRRALLRGAAVGGAAYAAGKSVQRRREDEADQEARLEALEQESQAAGPAPVTADTVEQLQQLAQLKEQGILTDEEFAEQKARILGS